jgi:hypothetical protein
MLRTVYDGCAKPLGRMRCFTNVLTFDGALDGVPRHGDVAIPFQ